MTVGSTWGPLAGTFPLFVLFIVLPIGWAIAQSSKYAAGISLAVGIFLLILAFSEASSHIKFLLGGAGLLIFWAYQYFDEHPEVENPFKTD